MSSNPLWVGWPPVSTPRSTDVPAGVRRITLKTPRGRFAAYEAIPSTGVCERRPALLVPGFTGSKEDFLPILHQLAAVGRRVMAIDMRGQFQTPGTGDRGSYSLDELGADVSAAAAEVAAAPSQAPARGEPGVHLLGHSFGGLVARETVIAGSARITSLTLMSSGPGKLTGPAAAVLQAVLTPLRGLTGKRLRTEVKRVWDFQLEVQARADGTPPQILEFLRRRMLGSHPDGLAAMAEHLLACPDRTGALAAAAAAPILVLYGEYDDKWETPIQEEMAERLRAQRVCIPGATHSPAVEAPETTASALNAFWNAAEDVSR
jgi:pimeloyl-ACP methyl ester carboxylesterase